MLDVWIECCAGCCVPNRFASGEASAEEVKDRQARSMADPEVQSILKDPIMQQVLRDFQVRPVAKPAAAHVFLFAQCASLQNGSVFGLSAEHKLLHQTVHELAADATVHSNGRLVYSSSQ
jgi:hypothetical protein